MALTASHDKLKKGDSAPDFRLTGVDGRTYSLADFAEYEALLVIFICNHCPYVLAKIETIKELYEKFGNRVGFIGVNSNDQNFPGEGMENMKKFAAEKGILFPYVLDETQAIARSFGATCTPDPFLFDREQRLVFHGRINNEMEPGEAVTERTMEENIKKLLAGQQIEKWFEPSMGCSIKWIR